jgi:hypothetical protein
MVILAGSGRRPGTATERVADPLRRNEPCSSRPPGIRAHLLPKLPGLVNAEAVPSATRVRSGGSGDEIETHVAVPLRRRPIPSIGGPVIQSHLRLRSSRARHRVRADTKRRSVAHRTSPICSASGFEFPIPRSSRWRTRSRWGRISPQPRSRRRSGRFGRKAFRVSMNSTLERSRSSSESRACHSNRGVDRRHGDPGGRPRFRTEVDQRCSSHRRIRTLLASSPLRLTESGRGRTILPRCAACHYPALKTGDNPRQLRYQTIWRTPISSMTWAGSRTSVLVLRRSSARTRCGC